MIKNVDWCWLIFLFLLSACTAPAIETTPAAMAAASPSVTPIMTAITPEMAPTIAPLATRQPTQTAAALPTSTPTSTAPASPTAVPFQVLAPVINQDSWVDQPLHIQGQAPKDSSGDVGLQVRLGGRLLAKGQTVVSATGSWQATLDLPLHITGPATLVADYQSERLQVPIRLRPVESRADTWVILDPPGPMAVAGHPLFLSGRVNRPLNGAITIGLLTNDCTAFAVRQTFGLASGRWYGFVVLPADLIGPACAVVQTGDPEQDEAWRADMAPLSVLSPQDEAATMVVLGNPAPLALSSAQPITLFGMAVNAENNLIQIVLTSDDGRYLLLAETETSVNSYGYWELPLSAPENYTGFALLTISIGDTEENYRETRVVVEIKP